MGGEGDGGADSGEERGRGFGGKVARGGEDDAGFRRFNGFGDGRGGESAGNNYMHGANMRARQHRKYSFGNHRHLIHPLESAPYH